jgi:hypothetical protein
MGASRAARSSILPLLAIGLVGAVVLTSVTPVTAQPPAGEPVHTVSQVVVYGGTPSGVAAAVAAARAGMTVSLIEPTGRIGGMMSSGLSWTDRGDVGAIGGIAREVFDGIQEREGSVYGRYAFAPSTAEAVFESLLSEAGVAVARGTRLAERPDAVTMDGNRIVQVRMESGDTFAADVFIDAGYEADLMARAGVSYRIGRESSAEYGESLAGVRPTRFVMNVPPGVDPGFPLSAPGPLGSGDNRIQASNYRVCLSTLSSNQVPFEAPEGYDPSTYDIFAEYIAQRVNQGQTPSKFWVLHVDRLVDGKWDLNHTTPLTFGMPGHNYGWPDGTYAEREEIEAEQRAYQQGFLYFLANDQRVPQEIRMDMRNHGLCADEFTQTDHWPHRMYVREGRRMLGRTVVAQHDLKTLISKPDTIGLASYPLDSHAVSRWMSSNRRLSIEGHLEAPRIQRWSIPYGAITPVPAEASNLLVSVAASATHVAFASLRVEPQFMIMGHAAGAAAALAIERRVPVQQVPISTLQARLAAQGAVLSDPGDLADSGFYTEIAWAYHQGITAGCGAIGFFCPSQQLPRDQMASLLARTLGLRSTTVDHFVDDDTNSHEGNINRVAQAGITKGCAPNRYCPSGLVTRQEMASFLVRALDLPRTTVDSFTDDEGSIHENDINRLAASGITAGCSATRFCPTDRVTRGQILAFLFRAFDGGSVSGFVAHRHATRSTDATIEPAGEEPSETVSPSPTPDPDDVVSPSPSESAAPTDESASPAPTPTQRASPTPPPATPAPTPASSPTATPAATPDPSGPP